MAEEKFPGKIEISLAVGKEWSKKYKDSPEGRAKDAVDAYLVPLESLEAILKLKESLKIDAARAYKGVNELGEQTLMFVGAKLNEKTGIYEDVFAVGDGDLGTAVLYDGARPCPPFGDPTNPL
ncbi:hypothetical protein ACHRV1_26115 [Flavobacterium aquidurense]|uniref:hypothetical protein n=1 Tax=Flavobacterium aquidurense TaxID=362413 RepID=UPI0037578EB1